ncbi:Uncharacterized protein, DUF1810 family [Cnuella takakiae]|uniref:Uncharacterized protein, DUF1810 family n=1 Tax=Cnuella takakiae TaxID=1302690 RepID=A0A1M5BTH7_9BACT|nr:DUF1810 domain-containing protein [Cnuella takakiae]OLY93505.1 calpastatin [Cnuella takakiae]SHF45631.1 Uncharacterized protein, DUF1810 family [Cnuella takakiae]
MPHDLQRFIDAQKNVYQQALLEISGGRKQSHWMWFIFPQMKGLGRSSNAQYYGIGSLEEASAYIAHPVLGTRLVEISKALLQLPQHDARAVLGSPDDQKLRSSMTLFAQVPGADPVFGQVLQTYFGGRKDERTIELLQA